MFERFTNRARRVVVLAQEESRALWHNYIGTEHVLLGLLHEGEGIAAQALQELGVDLEKARQEVLSIIGQGQQSPSGHIPFTPRAKKVLELSLRESLKLNHNHIGSEHILLGLIREGEGVAAQVLESLGAELPRVRQKVIELLKAGPYPTERVEPEVPFGPKCPRCHRPVAELGAYRRIEIPSDGEGQPMASVLVYCRQCGTTFGALPG